MLAAETLHAQAFGMRFAAVTCTAACLLVCHESAPSPLGGADVRNPHLRIVLTVRLLPQIVLATAEFDDRDFVALGVLLNRCGDLAAQKLRLAKAHIVAIGNHQ